MDPRIVITDSKIAASLAGPITIEQIQISPVTISKLEMNKFAGEFEYARCIAHDIHVSVDLEARLDFKFEVSIDWVPDPTAEGGIHFKPFTQSVALGDMTFVPNNNSDGEKKITISSDKMTMGPISMNPDPIGNVSDPTQIDSMKAKDIEMKCTEMPLSNPLGVYLNSHFPVKNPMDPNDILIEETNMKMLESKKISSPPVKMNNISSLNIEIPSTTTNPFKIVSDTQLDSIVMHMDPTSNTNRWGDADRVYDVQESKITLFIKKVTLDVRGGLEFEELKGSISVDSAISSKFDMDLTIKGMKIKGLNICGMYIPEVMVEL